MASKKSIAALKRNAKQKSTKDTAELSAPEAPEPPKKSIDLHGPGKSNIISKMGGHNNQVEIGNKTENATGTQSLQTLEKLKAVENQIL